MEERFIWNENDIEILDDESQSERADNSYQRRSVEIDEIRVEGEAPRIRGHAAVFNQPAEISSLFGSYVEEIAPGAFKKTLRESDVRALMNHNPDYVLGRNRAGTLRLAEDDRGLAVEIEPPDTQWARDLAVSMKRGDITQMSFGFIPVQGKTDRVDQGDAPPKIVRREVRLLDVSIVTFPAYPQTDAYVRSHIDALRRFLPPEPPASQERAEHSDDARCEPPTDSSSAEHSLIDDGSRQEALPAQAPEDVSAPTAPRHSLAYYEAVLATLETP